MFNDRFRLTAALGGVNRPAYLSATPGSNPGLVDYRATASSEWPGKLLPADGAGVTSPHPPGQAGTLPRPGGSTRSRGAGSINSMQPLNPTQYLDWVRNQPCIFEGGDCEGPVCAHHEQGHGLALKAPDDRTMALCHRHHMDLHALRGRFKGWTKAQRKQWEAEMVEKYRALYEESF